MSDDYQSDWREIRDDPALSDVEHGRSLRRALEQLERERAQHLFGYREVAGARFTSSALGGGTASLEMRLGDWPPPHLDNVLEYVGRAPDAAGHVSAVRPLADIEADLARAAAAPEAGSRAKTRRAKLRQRADASIARAREAQAC